MSEGSSEKSEAVEAMVRAGIPAHVVQRARDVIATLRYTVQINLGTCGNHTHHTKCLGKK